MTATTFPEQFLTVSTNGQAALHAEATNGRPLVKIYEWPRLMTVEVAAAYTGMSAKTIRNHGCSLPGKRKWGSTIVFDRKAIDVMLDRAGGRRDLWLDAERLCQ